MQTSDISEQDKQKYMEVMFNYDEAMRAEVERISTRKACDYHTKCRDCGRFSDKSRWVKKDYDLALNRNHRPLCQECHGEYDDYF